MSLHPIAGDAIASTGSLPSAGSAIGSSFGQSDTIAEGLAVGNANTFGHSLLAATVVAVGLATSAGSSHASAFSGVADTFGQSNTQATGTQAGVASSHGASATEAIVARVGQASSQGSSLVEAWGFYPKYTEWESESELFIYTGPKIEEFDVAFEQAGRIVVAAQRTINGQPEIWLYWFNPFQGRFVFEKLAVGRNPRCILDDPFDTTNSDVLVFYVTLDEQRVVYRQQRDQYEVVYQTPIVKQPNSYVDLYLQDVAKARDGRLSVLYAIHQINSGRWSYGRLETALYPLVLDREAWQTATSVIDGTLQELVLTPLLDIEEWDVLTGVINGSVIEPIIEVAPPGSLNPIGGPVHFNDDVEEWTLTTTLMSGSVLQVLFEPPTPSEDEWSVAIALQSGSLVIVLIDVVLFDIDKTTVSTVIIPASSSLEVV